MKIAFVYAGQGSQKAGMGKDFYESSELFRKSMDQAAAAVRQETDFDLKNCCFEDPDKVLGLTRYTQPCMVAFACGITNMLEQEGITADYVMGLSLGEYSALYAAKVLSLENVIRLTAFRGKVMEEAVVGRKTKMAAVLMMDREVIEEACKNAEEKLAEEEFGTVEIANYNCPGQIVISGDEKAVDLACELLKEKGGKKMIPLKVSGPFHTSLMKEAGNQLRERFLSVPFGKMETEVVFNVTGAPQKSGETVEELLEKQVQSSVRLEDSLLYLEEQGVDTVIEIGPGNAISKFIQKTCKNITVYTIDSVNDWQTAVEAIKNGK